jgi:aminopeptidase N
MNHVKFFFISIALLVHSTISAQTSILDSGGPLSPEQAAYDVTFYDLSVSIKPETREIDGQVIVRAKVVHPMNQLVLDLDTLLNVQEIWDLSNPKKPIAAPFIRKVGQIWIDLGFTRQAGEQVQVRILYGGKPRVAARAPWDGGFTWATTKAGAPWITTTCQGEGADLWWPCKDHVSDEPDSMAFNVRVPEPLVAACNGRLLSTSKHKDGTQTFHWYISTPINIYNVALNLAPYRSIEGPYKSVTGETFPVVFYVLPDDYEKGKKLFTEIFEHIKFYEKMLGPYPFRIDKYGVAQTPHLGMEHQSIIAYGANFNNGSMTGGKDWGFDALHHHEFGHEWWGNLVTNYDWKDMWIHEGFCTYMQALYMEELKGIAGYHDFMNTSRRFPNNLAVAPLASQSSKQIYRAPIYTKGAWILHALRAVIGKEALLKSMRRLCYDTPEAEKIKDGRQCHFVTTADFQLICEQESGKALGWFFDVYLRQPQLPKLVSKVEGQQISLHWETPQNLPFSFPVEIKINGKIQRLDLGKETITLSFNPGDKPEVDPDRWGLYDIAK